MYQLHHMRSTSQTSLPLMHPAQTHQPQSFFSTSIGLQPHTMLMCVVQNGSGLVLCLLRARQAKRHPQARNRQRTKPT